MICGLGRDRRDNDHPVCRSCQRQQAITCVHTAKGKKVKQVFHGTAMMPAGWITSYDLQSPNKYTNKKNGRHIYNGIKKTWARVLTNAVYHLGRATGPRTVRIRRYVSSRSHLMDRDNLVGSCKPLLDEIVDQDILIDDNTDMLTLDVEQEKGIPRVEIFVED